MADSSDSLTPIYKRLFETYRDDILQRRLQPGQRVDSINEIQCKHRVARETAKRVLRLLAAEGYIVQRRGKGSFVADLGPKRRIWGLVFPFYSVQYEDLILEVSNQAGRLGRELRHFCDYNNYEEEMRLVGIMLQERYEAVVVIPTMDESRTWEFYSKLSPRDSPVVLLDHTMTCNSFRFVVQSYDLGVTRAVHYLLERKPGGVAFVENEVWVGRNMVLELMRGTYLDILRRKRPDFEPVILPRGSAVQADDLRRRGVSALFCCDDISAIQAIGRLREQGAGVPRDFSVASYGNTDLSRFFTPPISSVDPRNAEMAAILAEILCTGEPDAAPARQERVVLPELVVRGT
ncbi:MAG: substrate-binding domain-containing protein [Candidatus Sumerlaeota bacterium]|nr:substrate-binding domain-containing protein [Candidatus Sumerlaeota bacterium]